MIDNSSKFSNSKIIATKFIKLTVLTVLNVCLFFVIITTILSIKFFTQINDNFCLKIN